MKAIYICLISCITLISIQTGYSQNNNIEDFTIDSSNAIFDGSPLSITSEISKINNKIKWTQHKGENSLTTTFDILDITGNWDSSSSTGNISITIEVDGVTNELILIGTPEQLSLQIILNNTNSSARNLSFDVSTITYL